MDTGLPVRALSFGVNNETLAIHLVDGIVTAKQTLTLAYQSHLCLTSLHRLAQATGVNTTLAGELRL